MCFIPENATCRPGPRVEGRLNCPICYSELDSVAVVRAAQRAQYDAEDANRAYDRTFAAGVNAEHEAMKQVRAVEAHPPLFGLGGTHLEGEAARLRDHQLAAIEKAVRRLQRFGQPDHAGIDARVGPRMLAIAAIDTYLRSMRESE